MLSVAARAGTAGADLLTVSEVATLLETTKYVVYKMIHAGELPAVKMHRSRNRYLVSRNSVDSFLAGDAFAAEQTGEIDPMRTAAEVARRLHCSVDSVRRLCAAGTLRSYRFAGKSSHLRIPDSAVEEYLARHTAAPAAG